jgi:hypothetical protein
MRRGLLPFVFALSLALAAVGPAAATTAAITPQTQSHAHNVDSHWTGTWSGRTSFDATFYYGNGYGLEIVTTATSHAYSYSFSPCPGDPTTYYQGLYVWDNTGHSGTHLEGLSTSTASENSGSPC